MNILNMGSINLDHVLTVPHFVRPGETLASSHHDVFAGGKGFNQSIALSRAGASVRHLGKIGTDGIELRDRLAREGVDVTHIEVDPATFTGQAIIQVIPTGENAILLHGGANQTLTEEQIARAIDSCSPGDTLLLQNETNAVAHAIRLAKSRGLRIVFNPAPMTPAVLDLPLGDVDLFILNETEAEGLTGKNSPDDIRAVLCDRYPSSATVLTLGAQGAITFDAHTFHPVPAFPVKAVDTTAAGDTFIGYFLATFLQDSNPLTALTRGCRAAALCVTRPGAADSIPTRAEVDT